MNKSAVIVAGGSGTRMGADRPKQFLLLDGIPILIRTVKVFLDYDHQLPIVIVLPPHAVIYWQNHCDQFLTKKEIARITVCEGGPTRTQSVNNGLLEMTQQISPTSENWVAIHDGVRPFINNDLLDRAFQEAQQTGSSVVCVPVKYSLRQKLNESESKAIDRTHFFEVQTPQIFRLDQILEAYSHRPNDSFTDDASLFEMMGGKVSVALGSYDNIKITTPDDMIVGEQLLKNKKS